MEKSIESIWKEGFLQKNAMVVPKLNNLYNKKSIHIIDKFKRMFKINLNALIVFSFVVLPVSFFVKIPVMGIMMFILFNVIVIINKRLLKGLDKIDKNVSSYQYLKSFDTWMQEQIAINVKMSSYIYPYVFIAMVSGFWFSNDIRETSNRILGNYQPDMIYGMPIYWMASMFVIIILLAIFGGRIYKLDLKIVYGGLLKKIAELISDMEDLRTE
tara:strand:+ start:22850 stop:23491 length:642 start_codon:yes stop_codon:yes gene_type:complete